MAHKKKKRPSHKMLLLKAAGAGMASATRGRARTFKDRKKEASRKACRGRGTE